MRNALLYFIFFAVGYVLIAATTAMFFAPWGAERNALESIYVFFVRFPFDWGSSLWFLPLNGIVWAALFYILVVGVRKLFPKKVG